MNDKSKAATFAIVAVVILLVFPGRSDALIKIFKTQRLNGQIINKTNIDNSRFLIEGQYQLCRFKGILFYGHVPVQYGFKKRQAVVRPDGCFTLESRTLRTIHQDASLKEYVELKIQGSVPVSYGKTAWDIDGSTKVLILHQDIMTLSVKVNFLEEMREIIPEVVRSKYGDCIEFRYVVAANSEMRDATFPLWAGMFSDYNAYPEHRFCELAIPAEELAAGASELTAFALLPDGTGEMTEYAYLKLQMRNTMGGERDYVVWCRSLGRAVRERSGLRSVALDAEVLHEVQRNVDFHTQRIQLSEAIDKGDAPACRRLFKEGLSSNGRDDVNYTFLFRALQKGNEEVINAFLENGAKDVPE